MLQLFRCPIYTTLLSFKVRYGKVRKLLTSLDNLETTFILPCIGNNYYLSVNM